MKDDRLQVPVDQEYVVAIGRAVYVFARLEWDAVWCCEKIRPGSINNLSDKTAGNIARVLCSLANQISDQQTQQKLAGSAATFLRLVDVRNSLLHAKPGTAPGGAQRLFRRGIAWTVDAIEDAADAFAECSNQLNALLHGELSQPP